MAKGKKCEVKTCKVCGYRVWIRGYWEKNPPDKCVNCGVPYDIPSALVAYFRDQVGYYDK